MSFVVPVPYPVSCERVLLKFFCAALSCENSFAESEDDGDGPLGEHHGARGFDHPPDYHSDDAFCEEDGICEGDGF